MKSKNQQGIEVGCIGKCLVALTSIILFGVVTVVADAQESVPTLTPQQMVEQLMPKPTRSRSARNLAVEAVETKSRPSLSLSIQFDFNSARVRPESQDALDNLAQALQSTDLQTAKFAIEGHTDLRGRQDYNQRLSQQRAESVRDYLEKRSVSQDRLIALGKGSSELANPDNPFGAENRRVRVVNLLK